MKKGDLFLTFSLVQDCGNNLSVENYFSFNDPPIRCAVLTTPAAAFVPIPGEAMRIRETTTWEIACCAAFFDSPSLLSFSSVMGMPCWSSLNTGRSNKLNGKNQTKLLFHPQGATVRNSDYRDMCTVIAVSSQGHSHGILRHRQHTAADMPAPMCGTSGCAVLKSGAFRHIVGALPWRGRRNPLCH